MENVVRHFEYFKNIYEKDDERSAIYASALFALLKDPTMKSAQRFNDWISRCNERINAKRERLDLAK
jgi:hypothetical protein